MRILDGPGVAVYGGKLAAAAGRGDVPLLCSAKGLDGVSKPLN